MESNYAETRVIGFGRICAFFALGPFILPVFILYSAGYWLKRNNWHIGWRRWVIALPVFAFTIINNIHNWTVCTILFGEFPREFPTTTRLKRLKNHPDPARRELADMMGGFLNSQDPEHY